MEMISVGSSLTVDVVSAAHGGEGIAREDGIVIFVKGALPGDKVRVTLTDVKKSFARGVIDEILHPSDGRIDSRCAAASAGAGCCDLASATPEFELALKRDVLVDQLERIGRMSDIPEPEVIDLTPTTGWRTRFRLGVDASGRAGFRAAGSNDIITGQPCSQATSGLLDDLLAADSRFTPGSELVVAVGSDGERSVVESKKAPRGRSVNVQLRHVSGPRTVRQVVGETTFELDPLGFWQAHACAPEAYTSTITSWLQETGLPSTGTVWDLYGGVGLFVPAILAALPGATVESVELGSAAAKTGRAAITNENVHFVTGDVARVVGKLPAPQAVVLDPPRKGAGVAVIEAIAERQPDLVIHVGCDPATLARDVGAWHCHGYRLERLTMFNAFPATHHSETFALLRRS